MKIGYGRVSTKDQKLELQLDALEKAGCDKIYSEKQGATKERPELERMIDQLREGDTVVVWKLDRLGRSLKHLIDLVALFNSKGVNFASISDSIDTTTMQGRLAFNIFASFAEFERDLIRERTMAGLDAARKKGRIGGRKKGLSNDAKKTAFAAYQLTQGTNNRVNDIIRLLKISKATYYRYLEYVKNLPDK